MEKSIPAFVEAHLDHGLPLLADLDLPLLFEAFGKASLKPNAKPGDPAEPQEETSKAANFTLNPEIIGDFCKALKGIAERKVLRRLILVCSSTGEELLDFELDAKKEAAALREIALGHPLENAKSILSFFKASGLFVGLSPASSGLQAKVTRPEDEAQASPSDSPSEG
jgi:hypothetical protein